MGHPHAGQRETENEDPHARTACGAPEKAKADPSSLPAWSHTGELSRDDNRKEDCRECPKATHEVGIPSTVAMKSLGSGPKAA